MRFQGKPFNITVIQVHAPTSNAEEAEVERFNEDLQDLLELIPQKDVLFITLLPWHSFHRTYLWMYQERCLSMCFDLFYQ